MKKLGFALSIFILICLCMSVSFAEGGVEAEGIYIDVCVEKNPQLKFEDVTFSLYSLDGTKLGEDTFFLTSDEIDYKLFYNVPFVTGDKFLLELSQGARSFTFYDKEIPLYHNAEIETYAMLNESNELVIGNTFGINLKPFQDMDMDVYVKGRLTDDKNLLKSDNGVVFCEMYRLLDYMYMDKSALTVSGDTVTITKNDVSLSVTVGDDKVTYSDGHTEDIGAKVWYANGNTYIPVSFFARAFCEDYKEIKSDYAYDMDIYPFGISKTEEFVMNNGIESKTDYLIWISKKDFKLHLFKGTKGNWRLMKSYPCTIGAPSTPTITGQFDYIEKVSKWYYPKYYVGPVMRFYNGYAIHSVLLKNDGSEYDGRLGMRLSLGCIRVKKDVMEYLASEVPMNTKIYIT